jgi:hypothetical protein
VRLLRKILGSSRERLPETGRRILAAPRLMPPSSRAGGGIRRQTSLSVSEFLASRHWRAAQGSPQGRHRRVSFSPYLVWTSKRSMPGGEQRQFDGQPNDDFSIEILVYRKSLFYIYEDIQKVYGGDPLNAVN